MRAVLISTYDMGRQPFGLASPAAWLREGGVEVTCLDLSRDRLSEAVVGAADLVGFFLPMHTATRLALPVIDRVHELNPNARLCAYGLYAPLNEALLRARGIDHVLGGEFEEDLLGIVTEVRLKPRAPGEPDPARNPAGKVDLVARVKPRGTRVDGRPDVRAGDGGRVARVHFRVPDRTSLPALSRYATLQVGAERLITGYTEASRGCKHRCRHCPIVPVYDGQFRVVPVDVVMADIRSQVEAGARHITFGDPDFLNGPGHARAVMNAFAAHFPTTTYDVTAKVEHLLQQAALLPVLRQTGCTFVTSAVESIDDGVLARLEKGHTRADFERVVRLFREADLALAPTFVPFTPWTTIEGYCDLLDAIDRLDLVENVAPIQLAIRLLVTEGSRLLELEDLRRLTGPFDGHSLTFPWRHVDPGVDVLQQQIMGMVGTRLSVGRAQLFGEIRKAAYDALGRGAPRRPVRLLPRAAIPYLNEPWYC